MGEVRHHFLLGHVYALLARQFTDRLTAFLKGHLLENVRRECDETRAVRRIFLRELRVIGRAISICEELNVLVTFHRMLDPFEKAWLSRPAECVLSASWNLSATISFGRLRIRFGKGVPMNKHWLAFCLTLVFFTANGFSLQQAGEDFCCVREALFVPIAMPAEQEYDASGMISSAWYGALRESNILDCPIQYEELSWRGRKKLHEMVEAIGEVSGAKPDPKASEAFENLLDVEYIWKGTLILDRIDEIQPGSWEEGYLGKPDYNPGQAYGDWTLHMQLVNVHFDEVVQEGSTSWSGSASGSGSGAVKNLARTVFSPVDDIIYDYEHIPWSCEVDPEEDEISVGDEMSITIKEIKDSKGREPRPWQRIVVKVEKGEITNGTKLAEEGYYALLAQDGEVEVDYESPDDCKDSGTEEVTIFNSCDWGQEQIRPLRLTGWQREIGDGEFEITCDWEGTITSSGRMSSSGDESLITALMVDGQYEALTEWKMDVVFKLDRANDRMRIYELKSARFSFSDTLEGKMKLEGEAGKTEIGGTSSAEVKARNLNRSECDLKLIIDKKKKIYRIEGLLYITDITEEVADRLQVDYPQIRHDEQDSDDQTVEHREEILFGGKFEEESPETLEGSLDEIGELPPDFQEFVRDMAGNISSKISWNLKRKGKH